MNRDPNDAGHQRALQWWQGLTHDEKAEALRWYDAVQRVSGLEAAKEWWDSLSPEQQKLALTMTEAYRVIRSDDEIAITEYKNSIMPGF